jgi:hypothetical protein
MTVWLIGESGPRVGRRIAGPRPGSQGRPTQGQVKTFQAQTPSAPARHTGPATVLPSAHTIGTTGGIGPGHFSAGQVPDDEPPGGGLHAQVSQPLASFTFPYWRAEDHGPGSSKSGAATGAGAPRASRRESARRSQISESDQRTSHGERRRPRAASVALEGERIHTLIERRPQEPPQSRPPSDLR